MSDGPDAPHVIVLAGPNGAGKSTAAPAVLPTLLGVGEFVNADVIAAGLSAFAPERHAVEAGRIMLGRLRALAAARESFAFETTLASRTFAPWLATLVASGYRFDLLYFYLPTPEMAVARVSQRVRSGGHHVPADTIVRRYGRGLRNFFELYMPLATRWAMYNNVRAGNPARIASGSGSSADTIEQPVLWANLVRTYGGTEKAEH